MEEVAEGEGKREGGGKGEGTRKEGE